VSVVEGIISFAIVLLTLTLLFDSFLLDFNESWAAVVWVLYGHLGYLLGLDFTEILVEGQNEGLKIVDIVSGYNFIAIVQRPFEMVIKIIETVDWPFALFILDDRIGDGKDSFLNDCSLHRIINGLQPEIFHLILLCKHAHATYQIHSSSFLHI
jgi:hypothetical protein